MTYVSRRHGKRAAESALISAVVPRHQRAIWYAYMEMIGTTSAEELRAFLSEFVRQIEKDVARWPKSKQAEFRRLMNEQA